MSGSRQDQQVGLLLSIAMVYLTAEVVVQLIHEFFQESQRYYPFSFCILDSKLRD